MQEAQQPENTKKKQWKKFLLPVAALILGIVAALFLFRPHQHNFGEETPVGKDDRGYLFVRTCAECGEVRSSYYKTLVTFIDDDAKTAAMLHWERIIDETGIPVTCAVIAGKVQPTTDYDQWAGYAGWDLINRLKEKGVDYVNHTYSHERLSGFSQEALYEEFQKSRRILEQNGIHSNLLVYPFYNHNETVRSVASVFFDAAFGGDQDESAYLDTPNFAIRRVKTNDRKLVKTITFPDGRTVECQGVKSSLKLIKDLEKAIREDAGWLVFVTHAYDSPGGKYYFDEESEQSIIDFCRYAQQKSNVKIVNATQGYLASQKIG